MKLSVQIFIIQNCGWKVDITLNIKKIFSLSTTKENSMVSNRWTVQGIVLCLIYIKNHTETCPLEWLISAFSIETKLKVLSQGWLGLEDFNKMMHIFSVCLNKSNRRLNYWSFGLHWLYLFSVWVQISNWIINKAW